MGVEFRAAAEAAASVHAAVCLGDRPINVSYTDSLRSPLSQEEVPGSSHVTLTVSMVSMGLTKHKGN